MPQIGHSVHNDLIIMCGTCTDIAFSKLKTSFNYFFFNILLNIK